MLVQNKRKYDKPEVNVVACTPFEMLCQSVVTGGGDDDWVDEGDALVAPSHNDWGDAIW
ncbi:MAG: hypothetical protein J6Q57_01225 [Paraprevotella sp.]|nr:hypothetical protein [Paraprevotella sp.]